MAGGLRVCPVCNKTFDGDKRRIYDTEKCQRRAGYLRNREHKLAYQDAWRKANPDKVAASRKQLARDRSKERAVRRSLAVARPRCLVCSDPIPWMKSGVRNLTRTCGKRKCAQAAWRWFGPQKPRKAVRSSRSS